MVINYMFMTKSKQKFVTKETETSVPSDLRKVLSSTPSVRTFWKDLTPIARRDFVTWVESAKQPETRKRRIEKTGSMIKAGKRRPCCYSLVPMNFYKALGSNQKAKAQWKNLTPTERRDFIEWMESVKETDGHTYRIDRVCELLASGKRRT